MTADAQTNIFTIGGTLARAPNLDLVPMLAANPAVKVEKTDPLGSTTMLRFNHLHPPFNNVKMRQALLAVIDQTEFMSALAGDSANWNLCASFFTCGTTMASNAGSEALTGKRDFDKSAGPGGKTGTSCAMP
jgi:peptide/nickel transport system substrate-binding protein